MQKRLTNIFKIVIFTFVSTALLGGMSTQVIAQGMAPKVDKRESLSPWEISAFDAAIVVKEDGMVHVTEEIDVTFFEEKHGIYREIPTIYKDAYGNKVKTDFVLEGVWQDGQIASIEQSRTSDGIHVQIGDEDALLTGEHTYTISYEVSRSLLFFDGYDELYWNVTGTEWDVSIQQASAVVTLPDGAEIQQTSCYVGERGSDSQDCGISTNTNQAAFVAEDFLTVAVGFDSGFVVQPTMLQKIGWFLKDNGILVLPWLLVIAVAAYWFRHGKDERFGVIVAEYAPVKNILPVYAGFLLKDRIPASALASMFMQMAVEGYLHVQVQEKEGLLKKKTETILIKQKEGEGLDEAHKYLFDRIFSKGSEVSLKKLHRLLDANDVKHVKGFIKEKVVREGWYTKSSFIQVVVIIALGFMIMWLSFFLGILLENFLLSAEFFVTGGIIMVFGFLMPKKTSKGMEVARKIRGFKDFLHTADRYRAQWEEQRGIVTDYLPYAMAFSVVKEWAKACQTIGVGQTNPTWYNSALVLQGDDFFSSLDGFQKQVEKEIRRIPSSSGYGGSASGGSGSSGGGFGGGGGGSW